MFPVGWHSFLAPCVKGNPFFSLARRAEVFEIDEAIEAVADAIDERVSGSLDRLNEFKSLWKGLPDLENVVEMMADCRGSSKANEARKLEWFA
jgi:hypothetical protein